MRYDGCSTAKAQAPSAYRLLVSAHTSPSRSPKGALLDHHHPRMDCRGYLLQQVLNDPSISTEVLTHQTLERALQIDLIICRQSGCLRLNEGFESFAPLLILDEGISILELET